VTFTHMEERGRQIEADVGLSGWNNTLPQPSRHYIIVVVVLP
jgi:hypothetical protein